MDRERIKPPKGKKGASKSRKPSSREGYLPTRRNMRLAIPKSIQPGAQETIKQRRVLRRKAKFQRQILRLFLVIVPLALTLIYSENMRQRALSNYIKNIEEQVNDPANATIPMNNRTRGYNTVARYPFTGISNSIEPISKDHTAFFWDIPSTGGTTLKSILGNCLNLVQASRTSSYACDLLPTDEKLHTCQTGLGTFINCDPSDDHGIQRCRKLKVVESGMADVIISSRFLHAASLFDPEHQARAFTIMRDPLEQIISTFYHLREAKWEREYDDKFKNMTLLEYAKREDTPTNWMVRYLTGKIMKSSVSREDLDLAKNILEQKFYVLLSKEIKAGIDKFLQDMKFKVSGEGKACVEEEISKISNMLGHPKVDMESPAADELRARNALDIELFEHAVKLFTRQYTRTS